MDISFWKNLSPDIQFENTSKKYFGQYLYKLEVYAPGCKSIHAADIQRDLSYRDRTRPDPKYNLGGSWWNIRLHKWIMESDLAQLSRLQHIKNTFPDVKVRTEEPKISFYASNEEVLKNIVEAMDKAHWVNVKNITGPESAELSNLLSNSNKTLVKRKPAYQYKVSLREKKFATESRQQILNYLDSLGELIKIPAGTRSQLTRTHGWLWGCYFYTNDPGVVDFVRLLNPDIVREVSELVYVE
jgi:hypothetical protein